MTGDNDVRARLGDDVANGGRAVIPPDAGGLQEKLGYPGAGEPYSCRDLRTLSVFARFDVSAMRSLLAPTPFRVDGDVLILSFADFTNASVGAFRDVGVVVPVRYGDIRGATYLYEWEDRDWSIAFGREVWGYPKRYGRIDIGQMDADRMSVHVESRGETVLRATGAFAGPGEGSTRGGAAVREFPHLSLRCIPHPVVSRFESVQVISRNTSAHFELISEQFGGVERLERSGLDQLTGVDLAIEPLYSRHTVGNYLYNPDVAVVDLVDEFKDIAIDALPWRETGE